MLANLAVGFLESSSIAKGIEASDAMVKMASVKLVKTSVVARGKLVIFISGAQGEVESSMRSGREVLGKTLVDEVLIRNVHNQVVAALDKRVPVEVLGAVGIIETKEAIAAVLAADAAAKAARVHLIEVKTVVGGGKGYLSLCGEVGDVRTAVAAGISAVRKELLISHVVIPQADPQLLATVGK
ncbi:MAG: propanediol utilization protein [Elusimicrobia bacterium CG11_big_fil_rev_8_21_14_0_20_64_6]|nr:MAG: propanediol utilization protein [Elusimicrobia bacterium CG11_big_fil_rev_8_21_14_0_20_64_6]